MAKLETTILALDSATTLSFQIDHSRPTPGALRLEGSATVALVGGYGQTELLHLTSRFGRAGDPEQTARAAMNRQIDHLAGWLDVVGQELRMAAARTHRAVMGAAASARMGALRDAGNGHSTDVLQVETRMRRPPNGGCAFTLRWNVVNPGAAQGPGGLFAEVSVVGARRTDRILAADVAIGMPESGAVADIGWDGARNAVQGILQSRFAQATFEILGKASGLSAELADLHDRVVL